MATAIRKTIAAVLTPNVAVQTVIIFCHSNPQCCRSGYHYLVIITLNVAIPIFVAAIRMILVTIRMLCVATPTLKLPFRPSLTSI